MDKDVVRVHIYIKWINNMVLPYSTENHIQCPMISHNGKEYQKNTYICICQYFQEKYQHLRYADDTTLIVENKEELKSLLMKVKGE